MTTSHLLYQGNRYHKSERAYNGTSAAYDLYADYTEPTLLERTISVYLDKYLEDYVHTIKSKCHLIPTGIRIALRDMNYVAVIKERGSVVKGTPLLLRAGVVDYGYDGEIFVAADCFDDIEIQPGEKLPFQLLIQYMGNTPTEETTSLEEYMARAAQIDSDRNSGCIGSSDKK